MARRKKKIIFGRGALQKGTSGIVIQDEVTPFMIMASANFPKEFDRAIRHIGFEVHAKAKEFMQKNTEGKRLSPFQTERTIDKARSPGRRLRRKKFTGDINRDSKGLQRAIRYEHKKGQQKVVVGWASEDARRGSGKKFQEGRLVTVTPKMKQYFYMLSEKARGRQKRRLLWLAGLPLGYTYRVPGRPVFDPVHRKMNRSIPRLLEQRIRRNMGLIDDQAYQAIMFDELGVNENIRRAEREAKRDRRRMKG